MSLQYILDGYNIIKQIPPLKLKRLQSGREGLLNLIDIYRPQGSLKNKVTIVFDGQPEMFGGMNSTVAKVVFSTDGSADDQIRKIVSASTYKKSMIVVTDDRELQFSVRALGAKILKVADFLAQAKPTSIDKNPEREDEKNISKTLEYKITDEFEKIWLKKDSK